MQLVVVSNYIKVSSSLDGAILVHEMETSQFEKSAGMIHHHRVMVRVPSSVWRGGPALKYV